jgi:hypothetical protein
MRRCPKCGLQYVDDSKICRACGAILDDVAELPETTTFEPSLQTTAAFEPIEPANGPADAPIDPWLPDEEIPHAAPPAGEWLCTSCGERVPANFDVCWNCNTAASALPPSTPAPAPAVPAYPRRQCAACGSTRVIPGATIADTGEGSAGALAVIVDANPDALIFKNRLRGELFADVCGDCGYVVLRVPNCGELYEHYRQSLP